MKLSGDEKGISILKNFKDTNSFYLKFLIKSAQTNFDHKVSFKEGNDSYILEYKPLNNEFIVHKDK